MLPLARSRLRMARSVNPHSRCCWLEDSLGRLLTSFNLPAQAAQEH